MKTRRGIGRLAAEETGYLRMIAAVGVAGFLLAAACGKITSSPVEPAAVDTGVAAVRIETAAQIVAPGGELTVVVSVTDKNGGPVKDGTSVALANDSFGQIVPTTASTIGGKVRVKFVAGQTQGSSTITATAGGAKHVTVVKIEAGATPPPPPPTDPPPTGSGKDEISPASIEWRHMNISNWRVSDTVTKVTVGGGAICIHHTGLGKWPAASNVVGNPWVFAKIGGQWYGATWEWLRPGVACKSPDGGWVGLGLQTKTGPLNKWTPRSGEEVGFAVSSPARGTDMGLPHRRTNIVKIRWP